MNLISRAAAMAQARSSDKDFYTYILHRPSGEPFYVGIGKGGRVGAHERPTKSGNNTLKDNIIRKIHRMGGSIGYHLAFFDSRADSAAEEKRLIAQFGRIDLGNGILANFTDGGEGQDGRIERPESLAKRSAALKRSWAAAERREAAAAASKAMWQNPAHREKVSAAKRERPLSNEARARIDASLRNRVLSEETREKLRDAARRRIMSEETRAKIGAVTKGTKLSDGHRAKISSGLMGRVVSPETRLKLSAAATLQHARIRAGQQNA